MTEHVQKHGMKPGCYLSRDSATRGVSTTLMAPFTSTMAVVLVWAKGCSRVQSSVVVSSSVFSMALLSRGVYGVLWTNDDTISDYAVQLKKAITTQAANWKNSVKQSVYKFKKHKQSEWPCFYWKFKKVRWRNKRGLNTCYSLPSAELLYPVENWLTDPALSPEM